MSRAWKPLHHTQGLTYLSDHCGTSHVPLLKLHPRVSRAMFYSYWYKIITTTYDDGHNNHDNNNDTEFTVFGFLHDSDAAGLCVTARTMFVDHWNWNATFFFLLFFLIIKKRKKIMIKNLSSNSQDWSD